MPDQTPVTDDDLDALDLANMIEKNPHSYSDTYRGAARAIRAHVPAPPKSLADELRELAKHYNGNQTLCTRFLALADRAEAVETELRDTRVQAQEEIKGRKRAEIERDRAYRERDEARANEASDSMQQQAKAWADIIEHPVFDGALGRGPGNGLENALYRLDSVHTEVERLTRGRTSKESFTVAPTLPDPADVPEKQPWIVKVISGECVGVRNDIDPDYPWFVLHNDDTTDQYGDQAVTLVSRLVPDTRRVIDRPEDLDALPVGSIVLDEDRREAWRRGEDMWWHGTGGTSFALTSLHVQESLPVTVIHEPDVTA